MLKQGVLGMQKRLEVRQAIPRSGFCQPLFCFISNGKLAENVSVQEVSWLDLPVDTLRHVGRGQYRGCS